MTSLASPSEVRGEARLPATRQYWTGVQAGPVNVPGSSRGDRSRPGMIVKP
jgi:hypothetical protein